METMFLCAVLFATDDTLLARLKHEAPKAWKEAASVFTTGKGRIVLTKHDRKTRVGPYQETIEFAIDGTNISAEAVRTGDSKRYTMMTTVDRYVALESDKDSGKNKIRAFSPRTETKGTFPEWAEGVLYGSLSAGYSIYTIPLFKLIEDPDFKFTVAERVSKNGTSLVKATFRYDGDHNKSAYLFYSGGWCLLDDQRNWSVIEYFVENPKYKHRNGMIMDVHVHKSITYHTPVNAESESKTIQWIRKDGSPIETVTVDFMRATIPASAFTLSAHNAPELPPLQARASWREKVPMPWWYIGGAVVCVLLLLVIRVVQRRV